MHVCVNECVCVSYFGLSRGSGSLRFRPTGLASACSNVTNWSSASTFPFTQTDTHTQSSLSKQLRGTDSVSMCDCTSLPSTEKCCHCCRWTAVPPPSSYSFCLCSSSSSSCPFSPSPPSHSPWPSSGGSAATSLSSSWNERWRIAAWLDPWPNQFCTDLTTLLVAPCHWDAAQRSLKERGQNTDKDQ